MAKAFFRPVHACRKHTTICEFRQEEWDDMVDSSLSVDEQVIFADGAEKFYGSLDDDERKFVRANIYGNADRLHSPREYYRRHYIEELSHEIGLSVSKVRELESSARIKWDQAFNEAPRADAGQSV